jgi:hypothetical protein
VAYVFVRNERRKKRRKDLEDLGADTITDLKINGIYLKTAMNLRVP